MLPAAERSFVPLILLFPRGFVFLDTRGNKRDCITIVLHEGYLKVQRESPLRVFQTGHSGVKTESLIIKEE
jgi:hypothetical protein